MGRAYFDPAIEQMKTYIIVTVYPRLKPGSIVPTIHIKEIMGNIGYPPLYRKLDRYGKGYVLYESLRQLGFEIYSRKGQNSIQAWIKPEVIRDV